MGLLGKLSTGNIVRRIQAHARYAWEGSSQISKVREIGCSVRVVLKDGDTKTHEVNY